MTAWLTLAARALRRSRVLLCNAFERGRASNRRLARSSCETASRSSLIVHAIPWLQIVVAVEGRRAQALLLLLLSRTMAVLRGKVAEQRWAERLVDRRHALIGRIETL